MATLSSSFFPPSNRRRCVKGRPSYAEPSDNILSIPSSKDESNENFAQDDLISLQSAETEDVDEEPITIDLSAFLNENPLLAQAAFESSVENNAASTESSSQFRVTDCEVQPSEIPAVETSKSDFLDASNTVSVNDNVGNSRPPIFLANTLVSDSHDSVKENCLNIEPPVPAINLSKESPLKITINGKKSPIKKFNKAKPLGLSNPLKKYKNFMKVKDLNKTNLKVFGKYPVVKCEKLDIDNLVKSSKIKISNWPPHPVKNSISKSFLHKNVGPKRSILAKGTIKPKVRKAISFTKYLMTPQKESTSSELSSLFSDSFEGMLNPIVIKTDNWKPEITKVSAVPKLFRSPVQNQSIISRSVGGILNRGSLSENLTKSLICSKVLAQKSPIKTNGPIITSVQRVINSPKTFKLIAPKPILQSNDIKTILPSVTKPVIEAISEPVANDYTVIEPYVEDPTSPVKPKPILTVPIEVLSSPEKQSTLHNSMSVNVSDSKDNLKSFSSVFMNGASNRISASSRPRKGLITVAKKQILKKKINFPKWKNPDELKVSDKVNDTHMSPEENIDVLKAKNAVVDAMQNVFTSLNKTKKIKSRLHKKSPIPPLTPVNTSNVSYSTTFNDLLFGFTDNDFEDVSFSQEDELSSQSSIPSIPDESLELSFKIPSIDVEANASKAPKNSSGTKKSYRRQKFSTDSPYTSDTLSASECENEQISRQQLPSKSKVKKITSTPKSAPATVSTSLFASATRSRTSSVSPSEDVSISSSLSEDVNSSENNKIFDNKVHDSSSFSNFGSSDEKFDIPSSPKNKCTDSPSVDVTDIKPNQNDAEHKENENTSKLETCTRTLRHRKCSSMEVKPSDNTSKQNVHSPDENNSKLVKSSVNSKLKIQMKTPPRSTAKVKIKQKLSKPDDILQEINTITGGKLKLKKGLRSKKDAVSVISNYSNQDSESNLSLVSSSLTVNPPSQTVLKKKRPLKVSFKRSKKKNRASSLKFSLKSSSSDVIENSINKSSVSENNESLHSSFREEKADKMENVNEENVPDVEDTLDVDGKNKVKENALPNSDTDLPMNSKETSVDEKCVIAKDSDSLSELDSKKLNVSQVSVDGCNDISSVNIEDTVQAPTTESNNRENHIANDINNVPKSDTPQSVRSECNKEENLEIDDSLKNVKENSDALPVENNANVLSFESNVESCDTIINEDTENPSTISDKKLGSSVMTSLLSPTGGTNKSVVSGSTNPKDIGSLSSNFNVYDELSTSCDSNNTEISTQESNTISVGKPNDPLSTQSNVLEKHDDGEVQSVVVTNSQDTYNKSMTVTTENVPSHSLGVKPFNIENRISSPRRHLSEEIVDSAIICDKTSEQHSADTLSEKSSEAKDSDLSNESKSNSNTTPKKSLKLKISFKNSGNNSPDKSWVVSESNPDELISSSRYESEMAGDNAQEAKESSNEYSSRENKAIDSDVAKVVEKGNNFKNTESNCSSTSDDVSVLEKLNSVIKEEPLDVTPTDTPDTEDTPTDGIESDAVSSGGSTQLSDSRKRRRGKPSKLLDSATPAKSRKVVKNTVLPEQGLLTPKPEEIKQEAVYEATPSCKDTPKFKGKKKQTSTPASTPGLSQRKRNYDSKLVLVPFTIGWMREHVIRATADKRASDVYYFAPDGTKLRSVPDVMNYLEKHPEIELNREHFTFAKELIFREPFEIERGALQKISFTPGSKKGSSSTKGKKRSLSSVSDNSQAKQVSATPNTKKRVTKKTNTPVTDIIKQEVDSEDSTPSSSKQSTLNQYLEKVTNATKKTASKFAKKVPLDDSGENKKCKKPKVSPVKCPTDENTSTSEVSLNDSANSSSSHDYRKGKGLTKRGRPPTKSVCGNLSTSKSSTSEIQVNDNVISNTSCDINQNELNLDKSYDSTTTSERTSSAKSSKIPKGLRVKWARKYPILQKPCTKFCNFAYMRVPSIECSICLCLFHPECIPYVFNTSKAYACVPCATNQTQPFQEECCEVQIPSDVDTELLYPNSSLHFYYDLNFDKVFNKFYAPIDYSFRHTYGHNYVQSVPVPSNLTGPAYPAIPPAQALSCNSGIRNPRIIYVSRGAIQQQFQRLRPSFSVFTTNLNTVPTHSSVPFQNVHDTNLPMNPLLNSSNMYRQIYPLNVQESTPLGNFSGSKMIAIKKISKEEIPKHAKVNQMNPYVAHSNPSVLQTLLQSNDSASSKGKSDSLTNIAGTVQKSMRFANPVDSQQYLTMPVPHTLCDRTCMISNRSEFSLYNSSPHPLSFPSFMGVPQNIVNATETASINVKSVPSNYDCQNKLVLQNPHVSDHKILESNLILTNNVKEPNNSNSSCNNENDTGPQIKVLNNHSQQQNTGILKSDGPEQSTSVLDSESQEQIATTLKIDGLEQDAGVLNSDSQEQTTIILKNNGPKHLEKTSKLDQCLDMIFKFLNIFDLLRVSEVCHSWKNLATQKKLWEHVCFTEMSITDWNKCCKTLQKYKTRSMDMRGIFDQDTLESWKRFSDNLQLLDNVETLIFEKIPPFVLKQITETLPHLRSLTCYCLTTVFTEPEIWSTPCEFELSCLKNLNHLQKLKISSMGGVVLNQSPQSLLPYLPNLTHIVLTGFKFGSNINLEYLSQQKQLISLELGDCSDIEPKIYKLLAKLKNLKNLCLQNGGELNDQKMPDAVSKMHKLENLELMNFKVSNHLSEVLKNMDNLSYFSIWPDNSSQAAEVNFNSLNAVMSCKKLRGICWGILTDDDDVPNVLELRDPNTDKKDIHTMTFEELFQQLTCHFPGKAIEMKCLPRNIWSEFCSSRDFL